MNRKRFKKRRPARPDRLSLSNPALLFLSELTWYASFDEWIKLGSVCSYCGKTKDEAVEGGGMTLLLRDIDKFGKAVRLGKVARLCGECATIAALDTKNGK